MKTRLVVSSYNYSIFVLLYIINVQCMIYIDNNRNNISYILQCNTMYDISHLCSSNHPGADIFVKVHQLQRLTWKTFLDAWPFFKARCVMKQMFHISCSKLG